MPLYINGIVYLYTANCGVVMVVCFYWCELCFFWWVHKKPPAEAGGKSNLM